MTSYLPRVRYLWQPTNWWGGRSFATQTEAECFLAWLQETRGDEIAETRIDTGLGSPVHAWINGRVIPHNQAWRYKP